ncbi:MAG: hypothetical protein H0S85_09840 [Desulfovibrionaceae bacterium]|nr:hypothetical protein [Desulfovibrionaceae bacterium]
MASAGGSAAAHATEGVAATQQGVPAPLSHHPAYDKFKSFAIVWAAKVNSNYRCTRARAEVVRRGEAFVARYFALDPATIQTTVKPSTSKASPFVGIMRYLEGVYESSGATRAEALGGPFSLVKQTRITEIFRYSKDDWVY